MKLTGQFKKDFEDYYKDAEKVSGKFEDLNIVHKDAWLRRFMRKVDIKREADLYGTEKAIEIYNEYYDNI